MKKLFELKFEKDIKNNMVLVSGFKNKLQMDLFVKQTEEDWT